MVTRFPLNFQIQPIAAQKVPKVLVIKVAQKVQNGPMRQQAVHTWSGVPYQGQKVKVVGKI